MYWLRWFGFSMLGIGIAGLVLIPWLAANGRGDEIGEGVLVAIVCFAIAGFCILWRRKRNRTTGEGG